jgi:hypothetical protein
MENLQMIYQSFEYLVTVLAHCDVYEKLYCKDGSKTGGQLSTSIVKLYVSVLKYLCHCKRELGRETTGKLGFTYLAESSTKAR